MANLVWHAKCLFWLTANPTHIRNGLHSFLFWVLSHTTMPSYKTKHILPTPWTALLEGLAILVFYHCSQLCLVFETIHRSSTLAKHGCLHRQHWFCQFTRNSYTFFMLHWHTTDGVCILYTATLKQEAILWTLENVDNVTVPMSPNILRQEQWLQMATLQLPK